MPKAKDFLTDEQVEIEIERLLNSDAVKLAKKKQELSFAAVSICMA